MRSQRATVRISLLASLCSVLVACGSDPEANAKPKSEPAATRTWSYETRFPGPTKNEVEPVQTLFGVLQMHSEKFVDKDGGFFVNRTDYPRGTVENQTPKQRLDMIARVATMGVRGNVERARDRAINGLPARDVLVFAKNGDAFRSLIVLAGRRMFHVLAATTKPRISEPRVEAFFDSFRLVAK